MTNTWEEIRDSIGFNAKQIIETDRGHQQSNGKIVCFLTEHKSSPTLEWMDGLFKFHCYNCGKTYDIIDHVKWLAHDDMKAAYQMLCEIAGIEYKHSEKINTTIVAIEKDDIDESIFPSVEIAEDTLRQRAGQYLTGRGIDRQSLIDYKVTSNTEAIFFNYYIGTNLVKIKGRVIGDMQNCKDKYAPTPKGGSNVLYGQHLYKSHRILAICEGEIDCLSLHTALLRNKLDDTILSSSIPSGSSSDSWIENSKSFIKKFESVVIIPDNDEAGRKFVEKSASQLIMFIKVRTVDLKKTKCNDVNELLQKAGAKTVCNLIVDSKEYLPDFTVDLTSIPQHTERTQYERSGYYMLDKMFHGLGLGLITLFTGHTGSGKTTILRQMVIFQTQYKHRCGIMAGEETPSMFRDMILRQAFLKQKPELFECQKDEWNNTHWIAKQELIDIFNNKYSPYISHFNCNHLQDNNRLKKLYEWIKFESVVYGTKLFIIDNLMKLEVGMGDNLNSAQGDIIDTLKNIAQGLNVHIIIVAHPKKNQQSLNSESVSGSQKIVNTVDNMVTFQRFDKMDDQTVGRIKSTLNKNNQYDEITAFFKVEKNRVWATIGMIPMRYDELTNCIYDLDPENQYRYGWTIPGRSYNNEY